MLAVIGRRHRPFEIQGRRTATMPLWRLQVPRREKVECQYSKSDLPTAEMHLERWLRDAAVERLSG